MKRYLILLCSIFGSCLVANPSGQTVIEGGATFDGIGTASVTISTTADTTVITWDSFSIGTGEKVAFQRLNSTSDYYVLNKVTGGALSNIDGYLMTKEDYGHIYLINPAGITVGTNGVVVAGSFVASTLDLMGDFTPLANMEFKGSSKNSIVNSGTMQSLKNDVILIGYRIVNNGTLTGCDTVALGAGVDIVLKPADNDRVFIQTSAPADSGTGITSSGFINGEGVVLKADGNPYTLAINHTGTINVTACNSVDGRVKLIADPLSLCKGAVEISGTIQRSVVTGSGSDITINGITIAIKSGAKIDASGANGGGNITIGSDASCPTTNIYVDANAQILSNATSSGSGGTIGLWAKNSLLDLGAISSTGISNGGNVNLLCPGYLGVNGIVNVGVASGGIMGLATFGTSSIDVGGSANYGANFAPPSYGISNVNSIITKSALETALGYGNVTIVADGTALEGDMDIVDNITWSSGSQLTLIAENEIQVNKYVTMTGSVTNTKEVLTILTPILNIGKENGTSSGPTGFLLTSGSIRVIAPNSINLYGGKLDGSFARLSTLDGNQSILFGSEFGLQSGAANGANAEMRGTNITINTQSNGIGNMLVEANDCSKAFIDGDTIAIGASLQLNNLQITAGCCSSSNEAYIGSLTKGSTITISLFGDLSMFGGSSGSSNRASIISSGGISRTINITAMDIHLVGGSAGTSNQARIASIGNLGIVWISTGKDLLVTGGSSVLGTSYITGTQTTFTTGRDAIISGGSSNLSGAYIEGTAQVAGWVTRHLIVQGGSAPLADAEIRTATGNVNLDALSNEAHFMFKGGSIAGANNASGRAYVAKNGNIFIGTVAPPTYLNLTGGASGDEPTAELWVKGNGSIVAKTTADITYLGGGSGSKTHAAAHIDGTGNITHVAGRDVIMTTGSQSNAHTFMEAANGTVNVQASRDLSMTGHCTIPNKTYLQSNGSGGAVNVSVGRDITQRGWTYMAVSDPNGQLNLSYGEDHLLLDCSTLIIGGKVVAPLPPAPVIVPPVFPRDQYYKYAFLYELFYRMRYFKCYDWFLFKNSSFWESTDYTDP